MLMFRREQVSSNPRISFQSCSVIADVGLLIVRAGVDDSSQCSINDPDEAVVILDSVAELLPDTEA